MRLVTAKHAASIIGVSIGAMHLRARSGELTRYPLPLAPLTRKKKPHLGSESKRSYLLDLDEVLTARPTSSAKLLKRTHPDRRLLTVDEVASILEVTPQTVRNYVKRYELEKLYYAQGTKFLIDGDQLADALEADGLEHIAQRRPKKKVLIFDENLLQWKYE